MASFRRALLSTIPCILSSNSNPASHAICRHVPGSFSRFGSSNGIAKSVDIDLSSEESRRRLFNRSKQRGFLELDLILGKWVEDHIYSMDESGIKHLVYVLDLEFNIEKLKLVEAEKKKIKQEYERKEKQVQVRKKMYHWKQKYSILGCIYNYGCCEYSMQLNASRIKVLQAQDDLISSMKEAASKELLHVSHDHNSYKNLLNDLIVQMASYIK